MGSEMCIRDSRILGQLTVNDGSSDILVLDVQQAYLITLPDIGVYKLTVTTADFADVVFEDQEFTGRLTTVLDFNFGESDPIITLPNAGVDLLYLEGDGPKTIDSEAIVPNTASFDFSNADLTVSLGGATTLDLLSIANEGTGTGQIGVSGSNVSYEGTVIGTFTNGANAQTNLVVTLNGSASEVSVQALVRAVTFENPDGNPAETVRTASFVLTVGSVSLSLIHI